MTPRSWEKRVERYENRGYHVDADEQEVAHPGDGG
jgi:hypothetical protein